MGGSWFATSVVVSLIKDRKQAGTSEHCVMSKYVPFQGGDLEFQQEGDCSMGGRASRDKGARFERLICELMNQAGIPAEKIPLSGAAGGSFTGDIIILGRYKVECKVRGQGGGLVSFYNWLGDNDLVVVKQDRKKPLAILPLSNLKEIGCAIAENIGLAEEEVRDAPIPPGEEGDTKCD